MIEFKPWPKIPRLFRECMISEKIDGTNAAVGIMEFPPGTYYVHGGETVPYETVYVPTQDSDFLIYAQSRKKIITPDADNFGFARWVHDNAEALLPLGAGLHFGEWWGSGIGRGYGLENGEKRFSLFNVNRYADSVKLVAEKLPNVALVPVLYTGPFTTHAVEHQVEILRRSGSVAAPGFMRPEGVITWHSALNGCFKTTLEKDNEWKGNN